MGKTKFKVVSCFDGSEDATAVFTDIIATKMKGNSKIIPFPTSEKNIVESEQESGYNDGVVPSQSCASGLCG